MNDLVLRLRRPAKELAYRRRHLCLSSNDQVKVRQLRLIITAILLKIRISGREDPYIVRLNHSLRRLSAFYLSLAVEPPTEMVKPVRLNRILNTFPDGDCRPFFGFEKGDVARLCRLFQFPEVVMFDNHAKMTGEEVFLRGLYELVSGETQHKICVNVFGRELTAQSRAFHWFILHMYNNYHHLVNNNLNWWYRNGFFHASADAISNKLGVNNLVPGRIAHFIDCNCLPTDRPGGGPAEAGANAARWDSTIQRAFYNGWKSIHGLKHQTVDNAYGMTVDMFGPTSLRHNDMYLLGRSHINQRMAELQVDAAEQLIMFGDSAYRRKSHLTSYLFAVDNIADFLAWNHAMKRVRISIEWNYGYTACKFRYVQNAYKLKVLNSSIVSSIYTVVTLLRNCYIGIYGGQTSNYFNLRLPDDFVEHYINQTDF